MGNAHRQSAPETRYNDESTRVNIRHLRQQIKIFGAKRQIIGAKYRNAHRALTPYNFLQLFQRR
jgi:hypothetical protein